MTNPARILVIDDEPLLRRSMEIVLQHGGYQVMSAGNGKDAIEHLNSSAFDLAFLDLKMPDISGLELLPEIHRCNPEMPVLILTAHATLESAMEAVRNGARDYLIKPIDPPYILARVAEVLNEQQEPRRRREIIFQMQNLVSELRQVDGTEALPTSIVVTLPAADPDRFIQRGAIKVDLHTRHVILENKYLPLPPTPFDYLVTLLRHSPEAVSYEALVKEAQAYTLTRLEARDVVREQIHAVRKALEPDPRHPCYIVTVRDYGFRLIV